MGGLKTTTLMEVKINRWIGEGISRDEFLKKVEKEFPDANRKEMEAYYDKFSAIVKERKLPWQGVVVARDISEVAKKLIGGLAQQRPLNVRDELQKLLEYWMDKKGFDVNSLLEQDFKNLLGQVKDVKDLKILYHTIEMRHKGIGWRLAGYYAKCLVEYLKHKGKPKGVEEIPFVVLSRKGTAPAEKRPMDVFFPKNETQIEDLRKKGYLPLSPTIPRDTGRIKEYEKKLAKAFVNPQDAIYLAEHMVEQKPSGKKTVVIRAMEEGEADRYEKVVEPALTPLGQKERVGGLGISKPTTLKPSMMVIDGKKYDVLILKSSQRDLIQQAQKEGWKFAGAEGNTSFYARPDDLGAVRAWIKETPASSGSEPMGGSF